jgi:A/G-specific adenine glycosylase
MTVKEFRAAVYSFYEKEGRSFPWRETLDPWGILVSEIMLQQTQTGRVVPYWERWMEKWPRPGDLHSASLEEVLREWSGLGYNRRARYLKECAGVITGKYGGRVPEERAELEKLPGIGAYTAGAVSCFAWNKPVVFIETNIRVVMIHFFFEGKREIRDAEILPLLKTYLDREEPRKWYWALMDYGAVLKKLIPNPGRRGAHYRRQSGFRGSFRELRGSLIRALVSRGPAGLEELGRLPEIGRDKKDIYRALKALEKESMVAEEGGIYRITE